MRILTSAAILLAIGTLGAQKNWVVNGDFAKGLSSWTGRGAGDQPRVETFNVSGTGLSPAFGVNAGRTLNNPAQPPYILSQTILVPSITQTFELYIDLANESLGVNNDSGDVRVRLGGVDIGLKRWGAVPTGKHVQRDILCARFKAAKIGRQLFEIRFERRIGAKRGRTPRLWVDNVGLWLTTGPSFCFRGDRKPPAPGPRQPTTLEVAGQAASAFVVLMSPRSTSGIKVPGFGGIFALDLATTLPFFNGAIPTSGVYKQALTIPASLAPLQGIPIWFQPLGLSPSKRLDFGIHHDNGLQR